jgi:hypothetical protein
LNPAKGVAVVAWFAASKKMLLLLTEVTPNLGGGEWLLASKVQFEGHEILDFAAHSGSPRGGPPGHGVMRVCSARAPLPCVEEGVVDLSGGQFSGGQFRCRLALRCDILMLSWSGRAQPRSVLHRSIFGAGYCPFCDRTPWLCMNCRDCMDRPGNRLNPCRTVK